jgi:beta-ribofuranosylaminobenzene 5'-phosphate synthase
MGRSMEAFPREPRHASPAPARPREAIVTATARLHFGFLDPSGRSARPFGSFGLSLDQPRTRLVLRRAEKSATSGPERERALRYLNEIAASCGIEQTYALRIEEAIPPHAGLGSGTQLALAVGSAFGALEGLRLEPQEVAARLGRGARSGIGIATFAQGGAVLDGGPLDGNLPKLLSRVPFPSSWRVLLIFDEAAKGLVGANEIAAFQTLPDFPPREIEALSQAITQGALPALAAGDFAAFCRHVGDLQARMGAYFAPSQGGAYASPRVAEVLAWLRDQGIVGLGQSSWGPTGFAFAAAQAEGEALLDRLRARCKHPGLSFALAQGRNEGARIEISEDVN